MAESSAVTAQGQAVLSQSESESALTHAVSAAASDSDLSHVKERLVTCMRKIRMVETRIERVLPVD